MSWCDKRLTRLEALVSEAELTAAAEYLARKGWTVETARARLEAEALRVAELHQQLGDWDAVRAHCAAELGVPVTQLEATVARARRECP